MTNVVTSITENGSLTTKEAEKYLKMSKRYVGKDMVYRIPGNLRLPLKSSDNAIDFFLDISSNRISCSKVKYQHRLITSIVLVRIDMHGAPHKNPDGEIIPCPHIHYYREGFDDKWANHSVKRWMCLTTRWTCWTNSWIIAT